MDADSTARKPVAQARTRADAQSWRDSAPRYRAALYAGSGFAVGLALTLLPLKFWSHAGGLAFSAAARLARSAALSPALLLRALADKYAK